MSWRISFSILLVVFQLVSTSLYAKAKLVSAQQVAAYLNDTNYAILDVRKPVEFQKGHLEGAISIWRSDFTDTTYPYGGMRATRDQMEVLLGSLGVRETQTIVLYDDKALCDAARLWWVIENYGYSGVEMMEGGLTAWKNRGFEITMKETERAPTTFRFPEAQNDRYFTSLEDVKRAVEDTNTLLVDTRSLEEYDGERIKKGAFRAGHIPSAIHYDWGNTVDLDSSKLMRPLSKLKQEFKSLGITPEKDIILYCQSGARSAHTTFVLTQLMGFNQVKNYDGSWIEWSYDSNLPIETVEKLVEEESLMETESLNYLDIIINSYKGYSAYLWNEITNPSWHNYFYWLIGVSLFFFLIEVVFPWRKKQGIIRKDFWLDAFYMFFNFFLFSLIIFNAASDVVVNFFNDSLAAIGINNLVAFEVQTWPTWSHLLVGFLLRDFVQWWIHRLLHRVPFLWNFHKVHHSVEEMGFAAHLRYHWMENVVYRSLEYIPLALIGIGLSDFFIIHIFTLAVGHWNHSNFQLNIGPLKYLFNNPQMHIWHHAYELPEDRRYGANFGLTLSIWDYLFGTAYIPHSGRDIRLGFPKIERFPNSFFGQLFFGFFKRSSED